ISQAKVLPDHLLMRSMTRRKGWTVILLSFRKYHAIKKTPSGQMYRMAWTDSSASAFLGFGLGRRLRAGFRKVMIECHAPAHIRVEIPFDCALGELLLGVVDFLE